ncbi:hypothetical protein [Rhodobacter calidifons]|uniref:Lipoprotein n=1 Tax=Rhodobacter calidifons TaxID=2715277 RepID=A0ABX0G5Q9_9RHOB|nr:hypothetical protein [Rhodobacter calidifons]NHB76213.1 hypothetical protein [Rhodobacter calidifons]
MKRLTILALAALAACGTPQEQCISRNTRDLRTVDRLIQEAEGNLARGYAFETVTVYETYWTTCERPAREGQPAPPPRPCLDERPVTRQQPKAIDLKEEARKLDSLKEKRKELARQAEKVIAACKAQYPE